MRATAYILPAIALVGAAVLSSVFIVDERERVLVLQFGQVKQVISEPGLGFKIPLIQEVVRYEDRILGLPTQPLEVTPLDDRRLVVDAFARWRIVNLETFRQAVGPGGEQAARDRLDRIINASIREVLGSVPSQRVLSEDRTSLMNQIRDIAKREAQVRVEEAKGIAEAQRIINITLTPYYLQLEAINAQKKMASSPNHTTVYIPSGTNGIPLIKSIP